jgi:hypothetical protein
MGVWVRATLLILLILAALAGPAHAQAPLEVGSPESAFAGGPIKLSRNSLVVLRAHFQGDKVPIVPQPFRGKLDAALLGRDWPHVEALKKELIAKDGLVAGLAWEQSRFIATGSIGIAEMHALDVAATNNTGLSETAVMLWFYAAAVTMTDGHKCADDAAKDAHLDKLRGPAFEPVTRLVRTISDDRLAAMRDLAIRLETVLAPDRNDDLMCRTGNGPAEVKPDPMWRAEASLTRGMLPRHLVALASVMRPHPIARPEPPTLEATKPATAKPATAEIVVPTMLPLAPLSLPVPFTPPVEVTNAPTAAPPPPVAAEPPKPAPAPPPDSEAAKVAARPEPLTSGVVDPYVGKPNPARFEPPNLRLAPADPGARP